MKILSHVIRWVVDLFPSARRARDQQRVSPQLLREALAEMLTDPETARVLRKSLMPTAMPIRGGSPGTQNYIAKFDSGGIPTDTVAPIFEDSSGNVGIGTTLGIVHPPRLTVVGPSYYGILDVVADSSNAESAMNFHHSGVARDGYGVWLIGTNISGSSNGDFSVYMNGAGKRLTILQNGNIGIGTANPAAKLEVNGTVKVDGVVGTDGVIFPDGTTQTTAAVSGDGTANRGARYTAASVLAAGVIHDDGSKAGVGVTPLSMLDVAGGAAIGSYAGASAAPANGLIVSGKVGIATASPNGILDVANNITYLSPSGGDDTSNINMAIAALPPNLSTPNNTGGIIVLLPGTYYISSKITITKDGVKIRGCGGTWEGDNAPIGDPGSATLLKWTGGADTMISMTSTNQADFIQDLELSDLTIDGNGNATTGLQLDRVMDSKFINFHVTNLSTGSGSIGILMTTSATQKDVDTAWNLFENCSVVGASVGVELAGNDPTSDHAANCSHNIFIGLNVRSYGLHATDAGIWLVYCDNNTFYRTWIQMDSNNGHPVVIDNPANARSNYFYHLQGNPSQTAVLVNKAEHGLDLNGSKNFVFGYDRDNGQLPPTAKTSGGADADPGDFLYWVDSKGGATTPVLVENEQETGFCSAGGVGAVGASTSPLASWVTENTVNYKSVMSNEPTAIDLTVLSAQNLDAVAVKWSDGSQTVWTGPFTGTYRFQQSGKTTSRYGFTIVVASTPGLAIGAEYYFQATYKTVGN